MLKKFVSGAREQSAKHRHLLALERLEHRGGLGDGATGGAVYIYRPHYEFINMESQTKDLIKRRNVREEISNEVVI